MGEQDLTSIQPGWDVFGSDGEKVGSVKEVGDGYLVVEKGVLLKSDIRVPAANILGTGSRT